MASNFKTLTPIEQTILEEHENGFQMYTGDYLGDCDFLWTEGERERLRHLWLHHAHQLSEFYVKMEIILLP